MRERPVLLFLQKHNTMDVKIEESWKAVLQNEFEKPYFAELIRFVKSEYREQQIYPPGNLIFNAFNLCPFNNIRVVIIGQDPYHGPGQAHGLCFSVLPGVEFPPSLRNIFKEIQQDIGSPIPANGDLTRWATQGVFLLNATLTVRAHLAGSHQRKGWETFTNEVIRIISQQKENVVFLLWGAYAQQKAEIIDSTKHLVLESVHPSPLSASRGFFGNHHFSRANQFLESKGLSPIAW
ncbi:MAG TPA: uracil-DNA glycosylase [Prolixibacteraceae bacterium]|nr:uracil-DNA glycosylase [Prolixibacteraceae bacterium]HUM87902.1 uracil-DNA glycosylase [Prolixibacteraceae bacterium]